MPRVAKELSALDVRRLQHPGTGGNATFAVGGVSGLLMQITPNGGRTWLLRVTVGAKRREIGLGGFPDVTLAQARERAREAKDQIRQGIDPVEQRKAARAALTAAQRRGMTFADATSKALAAKLDAFRNAKHRQQWENTLRTYAEPELGEMLVDEITVQDVLRVLEPMWQTKTETASRLRGRIEAVLSWATVAGHRGGDNPARWAGNLKELLPAASKVAKQENQPALQIDDAPKWLSALRKRDGMGARALEFSALTAARSQEVRGARWEEIDLDAAIWAIPAQRMKMDREHRVPLSPDAKALLEALPRFEDNPLVFPAPRGGEMSDMTLSAAMKRLHKADIEAGGMGFIDRVSKRAAVPHGLRSTFRDWVAERTHFPGDMAEVALAHKVGSAVEAAYRRGDMIEKRRLMMAAWAEYLTGKNRARAEIVRIG
ncbi:tyrosine-type recombinase/integrase [Phaeobacter inhibens]|uniref:tyrosine-type recombinase/integrase n=1 Tax=Phaeobacter inhibens TaxID=221822 RepID=UPI000C9C1CFB|nr:site-specific integrase [Phaeobacter inhibens]AUQ53198.1 putative phage integrase, catalytic core [Phaeobacter inhibens]AUQ77214.1 putative phage integrase, catalytic core [Phaeobacter inhibens]AUR14373.1 putative phage integrase, catalytic core [Phaeobacter inhibens]